MLTKEFDIFGGFVFQKSIRSMKNLIHWRNGIVSFFTRIFRVMILRVFRKWLTQQQCHESFLARMQHDAVQKLIEEDRFVNYREIEACLGNLHTSFTCTEKDAQ